MLDLYLLQIQIYLHGDCISRYCLLKNILHQNVRMWVRMGKLAKITREASQGRFLEGFARSGRNRSLTGTGSKKSASTTFVEILTRSLESGATPWIRGRDGSCVTSPSATKVFISRILLRDFVLETITTTTWVIFFSSDCQTGTGEKYKGKVAKTASGKKCQSWTDQKPHKHKHEEVGEHNFCRNPDNHTGVWCYTIDRKKRWEPCQVPKCWTARHVKYSRYICVV